VTEICKLEDLDENRLDEIKTAANMPTLKEIISKIPENIKTRRKQYVDCSDYWTIHKL